jgi:hypothetical protein
MKQCCRNAHIRRFIRGFRLLEKKHIREALLGFDCRDLTPPCRQRLHISDVFVCNRDLVVGLGGERANALYECRTAVFTTWKHSVDGFGLK